MFKKILIPTDFSACAKKAENFAVDLASKIKCELIFFHSVETVIDWENIQFITPKNAILPESDKQDLFPKVKAAVGKADAALAKKVKLAKDAGLIAKKALVYNATYKDIIAYADDHKVDLIVMGTHGSEGIRELFIGSKTQKIVRLANCPVITINETAKTTGLSKMVFASDFRQEKLFKNLNQVVDIAQLMKGELHLLYVNTPTQFEDTDTSLERMNQVRKRFDYPKIHCHVVNHFTPEDGVWSFVKSNEINLITISIHGFTGIRRAFNNNITETLVNHSHTPVMSLNS